MMYATDDPRATLTEPKPNSQTVRAAAPAEHATLYDLPGQPDGEGVASWYVRGQNFIANYATLQTNAVLTRETQPDEYMVLLTEATMGLRIRTERQTNDVWGPSLAIVPPGPSTLTALDGGRLLRLLTTQSADLLTRCSNAPAYERRKANVAQYQPWPEPLDGYRVRTYLLDVPDEAGRFGRIWRCSTFMINVLPLQEGPRDPSKLSPHTHDDFEQGSIGLSGEFVHHLRWPWNADRAQWRRDEHLPSPSPSVTVIPPTVVHTTEAVGTGANQLVDVFCPPRHDFSQRPGWVLNADEYPRPAASAAETS